jgi:hypothetical protein
VRRGLLSFAALGVAVASAASCNGTTGDDLFTFSAYAEGASGAGAPFTAGGYCVQLTSAKMHIGAVYVDQSPLETATEGPICIAPGVYTAQVAGGVDVDLLSTKPQEFTVYGNGTADTGLSWEIWLTDGDVNEANPQTHMVDLQGTATSGACADGAPVTGAASFPFAAIVTINDNRLIPASDPSQPGLNPICKQRIVQIGGVDLTFFRGGSLYVTVDPRAWFHLGPDFSTLPPVTSDVCLTGDPLVSIDPAADFGSAQYCIPDTNFATGAGAEQGAELFSGILTGGASAYAIRYSK